MRWIQDESFLVTVNDFLMQQLIEVFFPREGHGQYQLAELLGKSVILMLKIRKNILLHLLFQFANGNETFFTLLLNSWRGCVL